MNIITILIDSLNRDALSIYNPETRVRTPNIDRLAARGTVFDNHFVGSLPCMPARREIMAGRKEFLWRPWGPLEVFDPRLAQLMTDAGFRTGLVTDHYHYWEEEANGYIEHFESADYVRGHEMDRWKLADMTASVPAWVERMGRFRDETYTRQYWANVKDFRGEEDYFPAKVFKGAADWLDANAAKGPFWLHVENFDVHEPFDAPEPYASMYTDDPSARSRFTVWPPYQKYDALKEFMSQTSEEELEYIRSQYEAKVTMADRWLGHLLDRLDTLQLWDDTVIIFTTDHGHDLGQRGVFGKQYPHYDSHANIPLVIWHPDHPGGGRHEVRLSQTVDIFATTLDAVGAPIPPANRHSRSLMPLLRDEAEPVRDAVIYGTFGQGVCITDGDWTLFKSPVPDMPLHVYSTFIARPLIVDNPVDGRVGRLPTPPVDQGNFDESVPYPMWKMPVKIDPRSHQDFLFDRRSDPAQTSNRWDDRVDVRQSMLQALRALMQEEGTPDDQWERLGLEKPISARLDQSQGLAQTDAASMPQQGG
ncbi:sulfatase [Paracoccus sp. YLB-12]|uniref:Sulfatase n=1 Tax=Paracoccus maritimus TaxID=2933292 RepID=A0ABT2KEG9_9RHOB|nr:sulfatase [Paracoccus sp. YLB-12]MCT4334930.1 sulfatase [Paracoccus sp. YLB-12]